MNPDLLPALAGSLRALGAFAVRHEVNDGTLAEIAAELDRARSLLASARGKPRQNTCLRHPGCPVDPTAENGCLLCGNSRRRPAKELPDNFVPGDVLSVLDEHGQDVATERFGARAVAHAIALGLRHPSTRRPGIPAGHDDEGETP